MRQTELGRASTSDAEPSQWGGLYKVGCAAVWVMLLIFRRWLGAEFMLLRMIGIIRVGPRAIPTNAIEWFTLLQAHRLIGLILLNAFDIVTFVLAGLIFLSLYVALRRIDHRIMLLALTLTFVGIVVYVASNPAFSVMTLSQRYAAATTDTQRSILAAEGQSLLALKNPTALGQNLAFVFVNVGGLIASIVMLRSGIFSKGTAYVGLLHNGIAVGYPIGVALASGVTAIPGAAWIVAVFFWVFWYIGIARTLWQLAHGRASSMVLAA